MKNIYQQLDIFPEELHEKLERARKLNSDEAAEEKEESDKFHFAYEQKKTPLIPDIVYAYLPEPLRSACMQFRNKREIDAFLTAAIVVLSGVFAKVKGCYDGKLIYPPLFCFVIAPPASDKNSVVFAKALGYSIHRYLIQDYNRKLQEYYQKKKQYNEDGGTEPVKPKLKILYIPANSSSASVINHLEESGGIGIVFETEADTMAMTFKQDWGGYSDILRKAFHHETISYSRKRENEYIEVNDPRLTVALTGTPSQVVGIIKSPADGLFSRLIFYAYSVKQEWRDVSANKDNDLNSYFAGVGESILSIYKILEINDYKFDLAPKHWKMLNDKFRSLLKETDKLTGSEAPSTVKRLGLITYRISMVLSVLRGFENGIPNDMITCNDDDFGNALLLSQVYFQHSLFMFEALKNSNNGEGSSSLGITRFLNAIKRNKLYKRHQLQEIGKSLHVSERAVDGYLKKLVEQKLMFKSNTYGEYFKP